MITIIVGLMIGWVMDFYNSQIVKNLFHQEISERLLTQSMGDRQDFDNYIRSYNQASKMCVSLRGFEQFVSNTDWNKASRINIKYHDTLPSWLPNAALLRMFVRIKIAFLFDDRGRVREVFNGDSLTIPKSLLTPSKLLLELTHDQNYMTMIEGMPYILTSQSLTDRSSKVIATLMLITPMDKEFLQSAITHKSNDSIVALLQGINPKVLTSTDTDQVKPGTEIKELSKKYLITGKTFFDYGSSDLYLQFASLLSTEKERLMINNIISTERLRNLISTFMYILLFSILMFLLTIRIKNISSQIVDFSQQALGIELDDSVIGDEMFILDQRFNLLAKEIILSREELQKNAEELELRVIERTSELSKVNTQLVNEISERKMIEVKIKHNLLIMSIMSSILRVSLQPISLKEQLQEILELILSAPWFAIETQGSIFLVDDYHVDTLRIEAHHGLAQPLLKLCAFVPFGKCLCGSVAITKKILFTNCIDDGHTITFDGMTPHGHYCVPILSGSNLLGVINVYVKNGQDRDKDEEEFLLTALNTVAGIIERKKMEAELIASAQRLEETNEELKTITYIFSHDIRAPLVNLAGFVNELTVSLHQLEVIVQNCALNFDDETRKEFNTILNEEVPEALDFISSSTTRIDYLSNTVLRLSRLGFVELTFTTIDMESLVDTMIKTLTHQITSKGAQIIRTVKLPKITADKTSIEQIIGNLIDNAIKYLVNNRTGIIELSASVTSKETIFHIKDNGRGIALRDNEKIFAVFRRAGTQDIKGEGMGLSYAKTLIRRHNGRIWFESIEGQGTTFSFSIPKGLKTSEK